MALVDNRRSYDMIPRPKTHVQGEGNNELVTGGYVDRDPLTPGSRKILDPNGDWELAIELKRYRYRDGKFRLCGCRFHEGNRTIPEWQFSGDDNYCLSCRAKLMKSRRTASAQDTNTPPKRAYNHRTNARPISYNRRTSSMPT